MSRIDDTEFQRLSERFLHVYARVEPYEWRSNLKKSRRLIDECKRDGIETFNNLVTYLAPVHEAGNLNGKIQCVDLIQPFVEKIKLVFQILDLQYNWQDNPFELIDIDLVTENPDKNLAQGGSDTASGGEPSILSDSQGDLDNDQNNLQNQHLQDNRNEIIMAQTPEQFLKMATGIMNYKFNGEPLLLDSFLADIALVDEMTIGANKQLSRTFFKRCLTGRALECMPAETPDLPSITNALKANIKQESSDVISGKMMALKLRKGNFTDFTTQAEKLAEAYRRGLVDEGISKPKAQELAVKKTVELCRKTARSDVVKSVISSTAYTNPSEVLAKLVTENDVANKEKRETDTYRANSQQNRNFRGGNRGNRSNGRGNGRGNFHNNGNRYNNNYGNNSGQNQNQNRQNQNGNGNFRGNGNYRGNGNFRQNRGNFQNQNEHTIRFVSGNSMGPSPGHPQQQMQNPQQNEQVFHVPFQ